MVWAKYKKYVHDRFQIFTHIRGLNVRKLCKISTLQLTADKSYGQQTGRQEEPWEDYIHKQGVTTHAHSSF